MRRTIPIITSAIEFASVYVDARFFFFPFISDRGRNWEVLSTVPKMPGKSTTASSLTGYKATVAKAVLTQ